MTDTCDNMEVISHVWVQPILNQLPGKLDLTRRKRMVIGDRQLGDKAGAL
jgi:hypothetical protein